MRSGARAYCVFRATIPLFIRQSPKSAAGIGFFPCDRGHPAVYRPCPISHVPVAACRLVGIRSTAGQPPGVLKDRWSQGVDPYGRHPGGDTRPQQQPAAGGETGEPRSPRGTQLKATTNGLFWSRRLLQRPAPKRLVYPCPACGWGSPIQSTAASGCSAPADRFASPKREAEAMHRPLTPTARIRVVSIRSRARRWRLEPVVGTTYDRSHPRLPARAP